MCFLIFLTGKTFRELTMAQSDANKNGSNHQAGGSACRHKELRTDIKPET